MEAIPAPPDPPPAYDGPVLDAAAVDARAIAVRRQLRASLDAIRRADRPAPPAPAPGLRGVVAAALGPGDVAGALRRWRAGRQEGALERLEREVEEAQREVSRLALCLDALTREEAAIHAATDALRAEQARAHRNAALAQEHAALLRDALARAQAEAARSAAPAPPLQGPLRARESEERRFRHAIFTLEALLGEADDVLGWCGRVHAELQALHAQGTEILRELDRDLARRAAHARAVDLGAQLAGSMEALRRSVGRVHLQGGAEELLHRLDRLAESPDLLGSAEPAREAAHREVEETLARSRR